MKCFAKYFLAALGALALAVAPALAQGFKPHPAPDFTLPDSTGHNLSLADFRGKVVLLQFFDPDCAVCQSHAAILEGLYTEFKDHGLTILGVTHNRGGAEALRRFAQQYGVTYPLLVGDLEIAVRYLSITPQAYSYDTPHYFVINREETIVNEINPATDKTFATDAKGKLREAIMKALLKQ